MQQHLLVTFVDWTKLIFCDIMYRGIDRLASRYSDIDVWILKYICISYTNFLKANMASTLLVYMSVNCNTFCALNYTKNLTQHDTKSLVWNANLGKKIARWKPVGSVFYLVFAKLAQRIVSQHLWKNVAHIHMIAATKGICNRLALLMHLETTYKIIVLPCQTLIRVKVIEF